MNNLSYNDNSPGHIHPLSSVINWDVEFSFNHSNVPKSNKSSFRNYRSPGLVYSYIQPLYCRESSQYCRRSPPSRSRGPARRSSRGTPELTAGRQRTYDPGYSGGHSGRQTCDSRNSKLVAEVNWNEILVCLLLYLVW